MRFPGLVALLLVLTTAFACTGGPVSSNPPAPTAAPLVTPVAAGMSPTGLLPNHDLTPGETFPGVTAQQVCVSGYARGVRNVVPEQYRQVYASYGIAYPEPSGAYELDHLVPLELGGDNANRNLWPEPAVPVPGFHQKDQVENYLRDAVCGGRMTLAEAQAGIASDWTALYRLYLHP